MSLWLKTWLFATDRLCDFTEMKPWHFFFCLRLHSIWSALLCAASKPHSGPSPNMVSSMFFFDGCFLLSLIQVLATNWECREALITCQSWKLFKDSLLVSSRTVLTSTFPNWLLTSAKISPSSPLCQWTTSQWKGFKGCWLDCDEAAVAEDLT